MIKANEIRVGNILTRNLLNNRGKRENVEILVNSVVIVQVEENPLLMYNPIILTEKWLLMFKFELRGGKFGNEYWLKDFDLYTCEDGNIGFVFDKNIKIIKYVHELQNLYFVLTGDELNTKF